MVGGSHGFCLDLLLGVFGWKGIVNHASSSLFGFVFSPQSLRKEGIIEGLHGGNGNSGYEDWWSGVRV